MKAAAMTFPTRLPRFLGVQRLSTRLALRFALCPLSPGSSRELLIVVSGGSPFIRRLTVFRRTFKVVRPHCWPRPAA